MKVYISLPITGHDLSERKAVAKIAANALRQAGHEPINPFDSDQDGMTYGEYLGKDIALIIDQADAVMMLPGWRKSKGCKIEFECACICDKKIGFYPSLKFQ